MYFRIVTATAMLLASATVAGAQDYRVEVLSEPAPADELPDEIASQLSDQGFKLIRGENRTALEFWPCKQWEVDPAFKVTDAHLYPFQPGQLVGVIRYGRKGADFRDQDLARGVYTARYALQPEDGNHLGTSPTLDFLLLVKAESDPTAAPMDDEQLVELATEAAGTTHPAMLCLQRPLGPQGAGDGSSLTIRRDEEHDWWIVSFRGRARAGERLAELQVDLVVVGFAEE